MTSMRRYIALAAAAAIMLAAFSACTPVPALPSVPPVSPSASTSTPHSPDVTLYPSPSASVQPSPSASAAPSPTPPAPSAPVLPSPTAVIPLGKVDVSTRSFTNDYKNPAGQLVMQILVNYPQISGSHYDSRVNEAIKLYVDSLVASYERSMPQSVTDLNHSAYVSCSVTYNSGAFFSVRFETEEYRGGAHSSNLMDALTFDLSTGQQVWLDRFFTSDSSVFSDEICGLIIDRIALNPDIYYADYPEIVRYTFDPGQFYLSTEGLCIFFQQYDIAAFAAGIPVFTLPYSALTGFSVPQ